MTGHIPPSMQTPGLADWFYPVHKTQFVNILLDYSDVIVATIFGHDHSDGFKIIQNENNGKVCNVLKIAELITYACSI